MQETNAGITTRAPIAKRLCSGDEILLERTDELLLLGGSLVCTVTEFAAGVDPFDLDLFERTAGSVGEHGLAEGHDSLLHTGDGTLEHDKVVLDLTVADETTQTVSHVSTLSFAESSRGPRF